MIKRVIALSSLAPLALIVGCAGSGPDAPGDRGNASSQGVTLTDAGPGLGSAVITCSSLALSPGNTGRLGGDNTTACAATNGTLATVNGRTVSWEPHSPPTSADAVYASPFSASNVTKIEVRVQYIGDDKTEPLWFWSARNVKTGAFDTIGDSSTAGNWVSTALVFNVQNPADYVDASGNLVIRFGSKTSTNSAELDRMVVQFTGKTGTDAGTTDSSVQDGTAADSTAADSTASDTAVTDSATTDSAPSDTGDSGGPTVDLYDPDLIPTFELTLDAAAVTLFSSTAVADQDTWVHGSFKSGSTVIADVGVRRKGHSTFRAMPKKVALKVSFNKYVSGQKFMGLTDLTLNNMVSDPTFLEERLGYHVFRSVGLPAQKANTARVFINGQDYGLHANVETPDKDFLKRVYGTKWFSLYECNYGSEWTPGNEDGFDLKQGPATKDDLVALFAAVGAARSSSLLADVAAHLDTNAFLDHSAVEAAIGDIDGYAYAKWGSGNYHLAGDTAGIFQLVPWSLDQSFNDREGVVNANQPKPADPSGGNTLLMRCKASASCWATYKTHVQAVLVKYESLDLVNLAKKWHAQIDALALADPKKEVSVSDYVDETNKLYSWLAARPAVVRSQLGLPKP
jgi:spore coat protein CotH